MSIRNPVEFWNQKASRADWRNYILAGRTDEQLDYEGYIEAQRLRCLLDRNCTVIDYGCGIGRVPKHVAPCVSRAIGLDINRQFLRRAEKYAIHHNVEFHQSSEFQQADVADLVYCLMVLQHNDATGREAIVGHILSLLNDGASFIANFPQAESDYYRETRFVHKFTRAEVASYGRSFSNYQILIGNLASYKTPVCPGTSHEYFLVATK